MSKVRVLVVDDHAIVRRTICALLARDSAIDVICQTASGEDAVSKAFELQPDLVTMDIGLPGITGIEAARQIRALVPNCKIIFVSQHDSSQMVNEAMNVGGHGYVTKIDAAEDLVEAIKSVRDGTRFVSQRIRNPGNSEVTRYW
jgi:two-component system, NarL family, invasion response regulator UvrY